MKKIQRVIRGITCIWTLLALPILGGEWQKGAFSTAAVILGIEVVLLWASGFFRLAIKEWRETI